MVRIKNLSCIISTPSGPLEEYTDSEMEEDDLASPIPTRTVYIKAVTGQPFSIKAVAHDRLGTIKSLNTLSLRISLDGIIPDQRDSVVLLDSYPAEMVVDGNHIHERDGSWKQREFLFGNMPIIEDGAPPGKGKDVLKGLEHLGEIKVIVRRGKQRAVIKDSPRGRDKQRPSEVKGVNEKVLKGKGITHAVRYSEPEAIQAPTLYDVVHWDTPQKPYMVFRFLYRSEGFLKSLGFIPYTPTPSPEPESEEDANSADEELSREDLLAELRRLRRETNPNIRIKRERARSDSPDETPTRTPPAKRRKSAPVTIDLTDD